MFKRLLGIMIIVFSFSASQVLFADNVCGEGLKKMVGSLKLEKAQTEKIKPILDQLKSTMKDKWTQMQDLHNQIKQEMNSAKVDQSKVDGLIDKKSELIGQIMKAKFSAKNQISEILNDKQKSQLKDKMKAFEEKMEAKFKSCHEEQ